MDQNHFINTYIDITINTLQEYIKANLQLQTQVKVNESVVVEKDRIIQSLNEQLQASVSTESLERQNADWQTQNDDLRRKYEAAEANYSSILSKLSHMDNLLNQVGEMKKMIIAKDAKISELEAEIEILKNPVELSKTETKVINTKVKKKVEEPVKEQVTKTDDF